MPTALENITLFLIQTLFQLYLVVVLLRILLAAVRADFYHPLSQFIITVTNPPLRPLRRLIPMFGRLDTAAVVLALVLKCLELWLLQLLSSSYVMPLVAIPSLAIFELLQTVIRIYIFALIIQAILSWVSPGMYNFQNPTAALLNHLNEPILRPIRQVVPMVGMVDLSPLIAIIGLNVLLILLQSLML